MAAAPSFSLPRIAPPPARRKVEWRRARTALSTLIADPERTEQVFELIDALAGDAGEKLFQRFLRHPNAPELLTRKPSLLSVLTKRSELEASLSEVSARHAAERAELEARLTDLSAKVEAQRAELESRLSEATSQSEAQRSELEERLAQAEAQRATLETRLAETTARAEADRRELEARLAEATERIDAAYDGEGLRFQVPEVHLCIRDGLVESPVLPHAETLGLARTMDRIRAQVGVRYLGET